MSRNRAVAYGFGAIYLVVGILGFIQVKDSFGDNFLENNTDEKLLGLFEVNGLHNVAHLLIGIALLAAARAGYRAARSANLAVGVTYALLGLIGLFIANDTSDANILSLNGIDNILHFGSAALLIGVAMMEKDHVEHDRERDRTSTI